MSLLLFPTEDGKASKTGQYDDSVILDTPGREWISAALMQWVDGLLPGELVFRYTPARLRVLLKKAGDMLKLQEWDLDPYVLRHTGPSQDRLSNQRSLKQVKRRGRWASDSSVKRYEKSSRINARLAALPREVLRVVTLANDLMPNVLLHRRRVPPELEQAIRALQLLRCRASGGSRVPLRRVP